MVLFPEIFSNQSDKFNRLAVWLVNMHGVVCPNIRDVFTAGGQGQILWNKKTYSGVPKIIVKMAGSLSKIKVILNDIDNKILYEYWGAISTDKLSNWNDLVVKYTKNMKLPFDMEKFLKEK